MVKIVIAGVWACFVTLIAVYFSVQMATAPAPVDDGSAKKPALELVRGEPITVPVFENGAVKGYFLGRFSFMVEKEKAEAIKLSATALMTDELFTLLVGNKMIDMSKTVKLDLDGFRNTIKTDINKRAGEDLVAEVLVEQLDYLGKEEARDGGGNLKLKPAVKIVEGQSVPGPSGEKTGP
ncbi:hypothetical protein [Rhizobium sp.]|jgi:hypothetical protein|uniref:hypothetical protein n=1 Tax=Rhizobium sp. TaxID=391 RepID=UPI000E7E807D|nr:hypothetical protein [Rhizobium sp.]